MSCCYDLFTSTASQLRLKFPLAFFLIIAFTSPLSADCGPEQLVGEAYYSGSISDGGQVKIPIPTNASNRIEVEWSFTPDDNSAAVAWEFRSETDLLIDSGMEAVYSTVSVTDEVFGDASKCGNPAFLILKSEVFAFHYSATIRTFESTGMNTDTGLDFTTAQVIPVTGAYCGNINFPLVGICDTRHYFKVTLKPGETLRVLGTFSCEPQNGTHGELDLLDENYNLVDNLLNVPVYGIVRHKNSFTNESSSNKTYYLILNINGPGDLLYGLTFSRVRAISFGLPAINLLLDDECAYSISPSSRSFMFTGGTGSFSVASPSGCRWRASKSVRWITITSGSSGSGDGTVTYSVSANLEGTTRTATITVAGKSHTVTQYD